MGHQVHSFVWDNFGDYSLGELLNPMRYLAALRYWKRDTAGITYYHLPRIVNYWHFLGIYGKWPAINQHWFRKLVKKIVQEADIDIVVCSQSFDPLGLPPADLKAPLVFDYLDYLDEATEEAYIKKSQAVICASSTLLERAKKWTDRAFFVPTGIDLDLFRRADGRKIIGQFGLNGKKVISLIGITAHPDFYWLDGIELAGKKFPDLICLFVGDNPKILPKIKRYLRGKSGAYVFVGNVPYESIPDYFAASDIGMFPGHKDLPGDLAAPIKVLEYTACRKPVIAPELEELKRWDFPNVIFTQESPEAFCAAITRALTQNYSFPDMEKFETGYVSNQLAGILEGVIKQQK
jgi:glycosyltransferase involved in cell wall biosynthesis